MAFCEGSLSRPRHLQSPPPTTPQHGRHLPFLHTSGALWGGGLPGGDRRGRSPVCAICLAERPHSNPVPSSLAFLQMDSDPRLSQGTIPELPGAVGYSRGRHPPHAFAKA